MSGLLGARAATCRRPLKRYQDRRQEISFLQPPTSSRPAATA
ncbi:hypothetical protein SSAG_03490 [Streptomyces sp. Mg1]|nr:hypothetical protein SSAG_03490 [Streptomyces sp. Mg1]